MECLLAKKLQDGSAMSVLRFVFPGETSYPEWLPGVFEDDAPADWSGYYRDVFSGASAAKGWKPVDARKSPSRDPP